MKKNIVLFSILGLLCLMISICAAADEETFEFQNGIKWGMSQDEVIKTLPTKRYEVERERKLDYLEVDDEVYEFEKIPAEVTFGFDNDALVVIRLSFDTEDRGVSEKGIMDALKKLYGTAEDVKDTAIIDELMKIADYDEIDMDIKRSDTLYQWSLEDGTTIIMLIESRDEDIKVVFFNK